MNDLFKTDKWKKKIYDKKKNFGNKIILLLIFSLILLFTNGCYKDVSCEANSMYYFITRTEHGGETQIDTFRRYDYDENTIFYYVKWKYVSGDNTNDNEHLIVLNPSTFSSILYPLNYLDDYPSIKQKWEELQDRNEYTEFTEEQINEFIKLANNIREEKAKR